MKKDEKSKEMKKMKKIEIELLIAQLGITALSLALVVLTIISSCEFIRISLNSEVDFSMRDILFIGFCLIFAFLGIFLIINFFANIIEAILIKKKFSD